MITYIQRYKIALGNVLSAILRLCSGWFEGMVSKRTKRARRTIFSPFWRHMFTRGKHPSFTYRIFSAFIVFTFVFSSMIPPQRAYSQSVLNLPQSGVMVSLSPAFVPVLIKGIKLFPENPLRFDFILDMGDVSLQDQALKSESYRLIRYFMASLTIPEEDLWVNLSPYEKDRIIPYELGQTELGRDLLLQDYMLKQITSSLMHPESEIGNKFWEKVYQIAYERFGTTELPIEMFNKVWIVPDKAAVTIHNNTVIVSENRLKVMLEKDYLALEKNSYNSDSQSGSKNVQSMHEVSQAVIREVIIPELEREINQGKNFALLRQIYQAAILSAWFKRNLRKSVLGQLYMDKKQVRGIDLAEKNIKDKIYQQYLSAFKTGVEYIREDYNPQTSEIIPRKYSSGGVVVRFGPVLAERETSFPVDLHEMAVAQVNFIPVSSSPMQSNEDTAARDAGPDGQTPAVLFDFNESSKILTVQVNRPEKMNAIQTQDAYDIARQVLKDLSVVKGIIFKGNERGYFAGGDLQELLDQYGESGPPDKFPEMYNAERVVLEAIHKVAEEIPVVALTTKVGLGWGLALAFSGGIAVITNHQDSYWATPQTGIGHPLNVGESFYLRERVGLAWAKYYGLTGNFISPQLAKRLNLADYLINFEELENGNVEQAIHEAVAQADRKNAKDAVRSALKKFDLDRTDGKDGIKEFVGWAAWGLDFDQWVEEIFNEESFDTIIQKLQDLAGGIAIESIQPLKIRDIERRRSELTRKEFFSLKTLWQLTQKSPVSLRITNHLINTSNGLTPEQVHRRDNLVLKEIIKHPDAYEGLLAFLEKNEAKFQGNLLSQREKEFAAKVNAIADTVRASSAIGGIDLSAYLFDSDSFKQDMNLPISFQANSQKAISFEPIIFNFTSPKP